MSVSELERRASETPQWNAPTQNTNRTPLALTLNPEPPNPEYSFQQFGGVQRMAAEVHSQLPVLRGLIQLEGRQELCPE